MKTFKFVSTFAAATCIAALSATASAHDNSKVVYKGDDSARSVCMSIVRDNVGQLKSNLRSIKIKEKSLKPIHQDYKCNDLDLDEFAHAIEAEKTGVYLDRLYDREGNVTVEDVASLD